MAPEVACLLAVHPHPDDESIAMGGTLLSYADRGVATHVVTCTGGEEGENLAGIDLGGRVLPDLRREEMDAAAAILGLTSHTWLGYRDSGMVDTATNDHPEAFTNVDVAVAGARLAAHVRRLRPQVVASDGANGTYGHPDHVMSHRVTVAAIELAAAPDADVEGEPHQVRLHVAHAVPRERVRRMHEELVARGLLSPFDDESVGDFGVPEAEITTVLDVREYLDRKQEAMLAHRSQISRDSAFFNIPEELAPDLFGREAYAVVSTPSPLDEVGRAALAHDLFAGRVA